MRTAAGAVCSTAGSRCPSSVPPCAPDLSLSTPNITVQRNRRARRRQFTADHGRPAAPPRAFGPRPPCAAVRAPSAHLAATVRPPPCAAVQAPSAHLAATVRPPPPARWSPFGHLLASIGARARARRRRVDKVALVEKTAAPPPVGRRPRGPRIRVDSSEVSVVARPHQASTLPWSR